MINEKKSLPKHEKCTKIGATKKDPSEKHYSVDVKEVESESSHEAETTYANCTSSSRSRHEIELQHRRWKRMNVPSIWRVFRGISRGNMVSLTDEALLKAHNVKAVVVMASEQESAVRDWLEENTVIPQNHVKVLSCSMPLQRDVLFQLSDACDFIDRYAVGRYHCWPHFRDFGHSPEAKVLVTSYGNSYESTMLIYAYQMRNLNTTVERMIDYQYEYEPVDDSDILYIDSDYMLLLVIWYFNDFEVWENKAKGLPKDLTKYMRPRYVTIVYVATQVSKIVLEAVDYLRLSLADLI